MGNALTCSVPRKSVLVPRESACSPEPTPKRGTGNAPSQQPIPRPDTTHGAGPFLCPKGNTVALRALRDGALVAPTETGQRATCDDCQHPMSARVGRTVIPYWAHLPGRDRECAAEDRDHMSPWHLAWQSLAPPEHREVRWGPRRGDVLLPDGTCLEVQHSPMSAQEIRDRTDFWVSETGGITWIFDATISSIQSRKDKRGTEYLYWPNGRGSIWDAFPYAIPRGVNILLDTNDLGLLAITRLWPRLDGQPGRLRASFRVLDRDAVVAFIERRSPVAA